jgi:hypothetical protein
MTSQINKIDHSNEINQDKVKKALDMLAMIRQKQQDMINLGSDYIHLYVEDVEGDWLETWGNDEVSNQSLFVQFFNQNYQTVQKIKDLLGNKLEQFINDCDALVNFADEDEKRDQFFLNIKKYLGFNSPVFAVRSNTNHNSLDDGQLEDGELLKLVEELLEDFEEYSQTLNQ